MIAPVLLSRLVATDDIPPAGLALEVTASEAECRALAAHNGLPAVESLSATLLLRHEGKTGVRVTGELVAAVVQSCVVTLEPVPATVREPIDVRFDPPEAVAAARAARAADPLRDEFEDEPDTIDAGRIDCGALVAEHLTLGLDPYPRKPGAKLDTTATPPDERESPFAVLRDLKRPAS